MLRSLSATLRKCRALDCGSSCSILNQRRLTINNKQSPLFPPSQQVSQLDQPSHRACSREQMPSTAPPKERLSETADTLLDTAERCYRLARGITDRQAIESL